MQEVVQHFESLGNNCEFALVQRSHGYDKGSLLRWAFTESTEDLIRALDRRFDNLFAFENLVPVFGATLTGDKQYGMAFHSPIKAEMTSEGWKFNIPEEEFRTMHAQVLEKLRFLVDRLLSGLANPERIWVWKHHLHGVSEEQARAVHAELAKFGPNRLLVVVKAEGDKNPGDVDVLADGLYRGHITRLSTYEKVGDIDTAGWEAVLRQTLALDSMALAS